MAFEKFPSSCAHGRSSRGGPFGPRRSPASGSQGPGWLACLGKASRALEKPKPKPRPIGTFGWQDSGVVLVLSMACWFCWFVIDLVILQGNMPKIT